MPRRSAPRRKPNLRKSRAVPRQSVLPLNSSARYSAVHNNWMPDKPITMRSSARVFKTALSYEAGFILAGSAAPAVGVISPAASAFPAATFLSTFDRYRITGMIVSFQPVQNFCNNPTSFPGVIHTVIDYNDNSPISSPTKAFTYDSCFTHSLLERFERHFYPTCARALYAGSVFTGYEITKGGRNAPWIESVSNAVAFYSLKYVTDQTLSTTAISVCSVTITAMFEFKFSV